GEHLRERGLGHAGDAFEQDVAAREQGDEELVRDVLHADDDLANRRHGMVAERADALGPLLDDGAVRGGDVGRGTHAVPSRLSIWMIPSRAAAFSLSASLSRRANSRRETRSGRGP